MKPKTRRIIAREGLIVISVMLLAGISYCLNLWSMNQKDLYEANVQEMVPVIPGNKDPTGIVLRFPKNTNDDVIKQTMRRDFPNIKEYNWFIFDSPKGQDISASYDDKGQRVFNNIIHKISFSDVFIFFLIFAYPLYLLVRFVVWAIVTLKEKVEN
jgi:hypothetical protein